MRKWAIVAGAAWMAGSACIVEDPLGYGQCERFNRECQIVYSRFYGYYRACNTVATPCYNPSASQGEDDSESGEAGSASEPEVTTSAESELPPNEGEEPTLDRTRYSAFNIPCERDSQCGPGKCLDGDCYYGCSSDAQCGSGDRCAVESGTRICRVDPNPPVQCTRAAQCEGGFTCLNGSCRQSCTATEQCDNLLDRCASGLCVPDRRPLAECVLNSECAEGLVCLDGACVAACPAPAKDDICLAEPDIAAEADAGATPAVEEEAPSASSADAGSATPTPSIR